MMSEMYKIFQDSGRILLNPLRTVLTSPVGILPHDEEAGAHLKEMIKNLDSSSKKLDEDLEAVEHNFLLRRYFKKKQKLMVNESRK